MQVVSNVIKSFVTFDTLNPGDVFCKLGNGSLGPYMRMRLVNVDQNEVHMNYNAVNLLDGKPQHMWNWEVVLLLRGSFAHTL